MTLSQARKLLPPFACGLGIYAKTLAALRDGVMQEIEAYREGNNPLEPKQVKALQKFLGKTGVKP